MIRNNKKNKKKNNKGFPYKKDGPNRCKQDQKGGKNK